MSVIDGARWLRASDQLDKLLEMPTSERTEAIASLRLDNEELATDVEEMLEHHRQLSDEGFLDSSTAIERSLAGLTVGAYTLVSPIGHGGMGSVWLASRSDGRFEGEVAVKLLNAALVGRGGEERFRREGTILARLAHPHIARLIDAGVSSSGQPYLVLELVRGRHIDAYCNEERLTIDERIRLFLDVQSAVSHAHANLIVHRDLKPPNVLITGAGAAKLLDFGIAKLTEDEAVSGITLESGSALTPRYAAPEQLTGGRVTTATDVYALGVLLYELLSGVHPVGENPRSAAELTAAIVDVDCLPLSALVRRASVEQRTVLASLRRTTPDRLLRQLSGELTTILAKALKKDPAERYRSVAEFAGDLRRYLDHAPISARPDTLRYRSSKFIRRHWRGVVAAAAIVTGLAALIGFHTAQLSAERDRATMQAAKAAQVSELLTSILTSVDPYRTPGASEPTVRNLLDASAARVGSELSDQPELQAEMYTVIGRTYARLGMNEHALPVLEQALAIGRRSFGAEHVRVAQTLNDLGVLHRQAGRLTVAEPLLRESLEQRRRLLGNNDKDVAVTLVEWARALKDSRQLAESEAPIREALAIRRQLFGDEHRETATSKSELGLLLWERGDLAAAEPLLRENVATSERLLGRDHPNVGAAKGSLGAMLNAKDDPVSAEPWLREAVRNRRQVFGETSSEHLTSLANLANALELQGKADEASRLLQQALAVTQPSLGANHPRVINVAVDLARLDIARGRAALTEPTLRQALQERQRIYAAGDWRVGQAQSLLAAALVAQGRSAEAEPLMHAAAAALGPVPGRQGRERAANLARLGTLQR